VRLWGAAAAALLVLAGCGVEPEQSARPLPSEYAGARAPGIGDADGVGILHELWFVHDNRLVSVNRQRETAPSPEDILSLLESGPTADEMDDGLRTALASVVPDRTLVSTAESAGLSVPVGTGQTAIVLSEEFSDLPSQEQLLILGQIAMSLASEPGHSVLFVNSTGTPVGVPLPNGRLSSGAVNPNNYADLVE
jgi:hypothetical protein